MIRLARILIANRGEIACRVIRTAQRLGIATVAVYSDADRDALHVRMADEAIRLGPARAADSYLAIERVLAAARHARADAIHPGYGFLAENARFARASADAGMVFVGPRAESIERMGSKSEAKRLMEAAGVPVVPGYHGSDQADAVLTREAERIGFPLMIKAVAGGGGKGMRIVHDAAGFADALAGARRESASSFGDDTVLLERYVNEPRHIEFQVFGDTHGNVVHLYERECSIQRRYQKIMEESPSPFLDADLRAAMADAAVAAARAVDYVNAGTIEFIVGADRAFYFMEMNTRLQVEHPVTEMITGLDLVEWQLRVAAGEPLPLAQEAIRCDGHAIEARIYAENPARGFLPATGRIEAFRHVTTDRVHRLDAAVEAGDEVTPHYDPMIAKLIVHAPDRTSAIDRLTGALADTVIAGPATNLALLRRIARNRDFQSGDIDTRYIDAHLEELVEAEPVPALRLFAAAGRLMLDREHGLPAADESPWGLSDAWQTVRDRGRRIAFEHGGQRYLLHAAGSGGRYRMQLANEVVEIAVQALSHDRYAVDFDGPRVVSIVVAGRDWVVSDDQGASELVLAVPYPIARAVADEAAHPGSPLPGRVVAVEVAAGDRVSSGDPLVVIEGMKMEHTVRARAAGRIERVAVNVGDQVEADAILVDIEPEQPE
jgi:3-methylcrotonyl-CoA carboxylase alpha subunit